MKFRCLPLVVLGLISLSSQARADIVWERDYMTALNKSRSTGKPLFIDFYTDWCGWCKRLDSNVYTDGRVQQMARSFVMLKLDAERGGRAAAQAFRVEGYPTLVFASARGQMLNRYDGYIEANDFAGAMANSLQRNGGAPTTPPAQATNQTKTAGVVTPQYVDPVIKRMSLAQGANNWKNQPELRKAAGSDNYGGAFLLDENGVVALDKPAKKPAATVKKTGKPAKTTAKRKRK